jgi:ribosomal protein S18 acetylase RimI-like enzyme
MSEAAAAGQPVAFVIRSASPDEAETVAAIVRDGFATEAAVYGDIPPLHETTADVEATFDAGDVTLVAEVDGAAVGTVRGETMDGGDLMVRRLAVLPEARGRGIGRALLVALEAAYPDAPRFELFTGNSSDAALGLYESLGYVRTRSHEVAPGVELVTLEKPVR